MYNTSRMRSVQIVVAPMTTKTALTASLWFSSPFPISPQPPAPASPFDPRAKFHLLHKRTLIAFQRFPKSNFVERQREQLNELLDILHLSEEVDIWQMRETVQH